jgi:phosphoribosyl-AMP cyclohydrolase
MRIPAEVAAQLANGAFVAAIAQDASNGQVLMLAWMNQEALNKTLESGTVTYWSRSRKQLWTKGETSGHLQKLVSLSYDCDGDALLLQVEQVGAACHTGERSCFFREFESQK